MRRGDVIYAIDGAPVSGSADLKGMIEARDVGQSLRITVGRGAADRVVQVKTQETHRRLAPSNTFGRAKEKTWAGMSMVNPPPTYS